MRLWGGGRMISCAGRVLCSCFLLALGVPGLTPELLLDYDDRGSPRGRQTLFLFASTACCPLGITGTMLDRIMSMHRALMPDNLTLAFVVSTSLMLFANRIAAVYDPIASPRT